MGGLEVVMNLKEIGGGLGIEYNENRLYVYTQFLKK